MSELAERYFEKALDAVKRQDYRHACVLLVEAIKLKPDFVEALIVRGNIRHAQGEPLDAILHYDRALSFKEDAHDAWNNRGMAFADIGMWDTAEASFRKSAELLPALEPHMGLANMYCTLMKLPEAAAEYRSAVEHGAGADARFNLGVTLLGMGQWEEGFAEYEHRWDNTPYPPRAYRDYPKWRGEDLSREVILLYGEQGYGDEIMALRFAILLKAAYPTAHVMVQARTPALRLVRSIVSKYGIGVACHDENPYAEYSCPLLDVPMVMGLTPDMVSHGRYLSAPNHRLVEEWNARLPTDKLNVGLCWSSGGHLNTAQAARHAKSIPLPWLKGLALPGVNLVSLQKPREAVPDGFDIDLGPIDECHDFADTAALIEALDMVISVDTAVAHLAGALGKRVWNFVRYSGYWPWLTSEAAGGPSHSIWYPSMRLLRQPSLANWDYPIKQAIAMLPMVERDHEYEDNRL